MSSLFILLLNRNFWSTQKLQVIPKFRFKSKLRLNQEPKPKRFISVSQNFGNNRNRTEFRLITTHLLLVCELSMTEHAISMRPIGITLCCSLKVVTSYHSERGRTVVSFMLKDATINFGCHA